ncbi:hypothetical protein XENTR_v10008871 [Xenopus tropicalis]|nr:hypothetical protein XENTR_v10008871 [Xenopus tropicalis]
MYPVGNRPLKQHQGTYTVYSSPLTIGYFTVSMICPFQVALAMHIIIKLPLQKMKETAQKHVKDHRSPKYMQQPNLFLAVN